MENVVVASFDPTVFSPRPLSDLQAHRTLKWEIATRDYPRLCTAHLALKVPIVLTTSANIRKYHKAAAYPRLEAIYYDPFTRFYHVPLPIRPKEEPFNQIINRTPTDGEMNRFFKRCKNIANKNYTRKVEHSHQPKAQALKLDEPQPSTSKTLIVDTETFDFTVPRIEYPRKVTMQDAPIPRKENGEAKDYADLTPLELIAILNFTQALDNLVPNTKFKPARIPNDGYSIKFKDDDLDSDSDIDPEIF